jgi:magnesium transporter
MPINENRNFSEEIVSLVRGKYSPAILREKIEDYHENSIADALALMTVAERQRLYRIIDTEMLADVLSYVDDDVLTTYLKEMSTSFQAKIISELDSDRTVDFLKSLDKKERDTIISLMDRSKMKEVAMLATFDEDQIGSRMTTDFITVRKDLTVPEAMKALISEAADNDNITTIYAVNQDGTFYGAVSLKDLIIARKEDNFESLITTSYPFVYAKEEIDSCVEWI